MDFVFSESCVVSECKHSTRFDPFCSSGQPGCFQSGVSVNSAKSMSVLMRTQLGHNGWLTGHPYVHGGGFCQAIF